jgi:hypothetical protein
MAKPVRRITETGVRRRVTMLSETTEYPGYLHIGPLVGGGTVSVLRVGFKGQALRVRDIRVRMEVDAERTDFLRMLIRYGVPTECMLTMHHGRFLARCWCTSCPARVVGGPAGGLATFTIEGELAPLDQPAPS